MRTWISAGLVVTALLAASACGGDDGDEESEHSLKTNKKPTDTVTVDLAEYTIKPDKPAVAKGPIKFVARNASKTDVHELAVLRTKPDGSFDNTGEVEDLKPGASGSIVLDLPTGRYVLACLIVPGQEGSTKDHFKEGMKVDFEVR